MLDIQAIITGDAALQAKFESLSNKGSRLSLRSALNIGMKVLRVAIKAAIPDAKTPGHDMKHIRKAVGMRFVSKRRLGLTEAKVGFHVGKQRETRVSKAARKLRGEKRKAAPHRTPHAHLLAAGTGMRRTKLTHANRGLVKPGNYIPRAVATSSSAAGAAMESKLREEIYKDATQ